MFLKTLRELLLQSHLFKSGYLPDSVVLVLGDSTECDEALIVDLLQFLQIGVPPEEDEKDRNFFESIIDGLFSSNSDDYSDNIQTKLSVQFRNIDLTTGIEIDRISVTVLHTGGTKPESKKKHWKNFVNWYLMKCG